MIAILLSREPVTVHEFGCEIVFVLALVDRLRDVRALFQSNGITDYRNGS